MKIAEVSVNLNSLPTRKQLIKLAMVSKRYYQERNAEELINIEIDKSGLYRNIQKGTGISNKPDKTPRKR